MPLNKYSRSLLRKTRNYQTRSGIHLGFGGIGSRRHSIGLGGATVNLVKSRK
jgi:hypothetical protein